MSPRVRRLLQALAGLGAAAGAVAWYVQHQQHQAHVDTVNRQQAEMDMAVFKTRLAGPPAHRVLQVGDNELIVLDVLSDAGLGPRMAGAQRCYVWRDARLRTASLSCPHAEELRSMQE